jgi:hypothetical protein
MFFQRYKQLLAGIIIGLLCALPCGALAKATQQVSAWAAEQISFVFDGEKKELPAGYTVLLYNDRTYVPARFVAEELGAEVDWLEEAQTVKITSLPCPACLEREAGQEDEGTGPEKPEIKEPVEEENKQPERDYRKLPQTKVLHDMEVSVTLIVDDEVTKENYSRVYVHIENKGDTPLQLVQRQTRAIVDGEEYKTASVPDYKYPERWYHDIAPEQKDEGYVVLPFLPEDAKEMLLELTILYNDVTQKTETVEFAIKLAP